MMCYNWLNDNQREAMHFMFKNTISSAGVPIESLVFLSLSAMYKRRSIHQHYEFDEWLELLLDDSIYRRCCSAYEIAPAINAIISQFIAEERLIKIDDCEVKL